MAGFFFFLKTALELNFGLGYDKMKQTKKPFEIMGRKCEVIPTYGVYERNWK
jgi:hypothetical protein